jgi:hypothetical protein
VAAHELPFGSTYRTNPDAWPAEPDTVTGQSSSVKRVGGTVRVIEEAGSVVSVVSSPATVPPLSVAASR